jgi:hypothetical protein
MKKITIEVPEGKTAKWEGNSIIFVDDNVMDRVKTFLDACKELGEDHPLIVEYRTISRIRLSPDIIAYFRLRIIVAALNEGWEPTFKNEEIRYYPWFELISTNANNGIVYCFASKDSAYSSAYTGAHLAFKNKKLAQYAGTQFINEYKEFLLK